MSRRTGVRAKGDAASPLRQLRLDLPPPPPRYNAAAFAVTAINCAACGLGRALARSAEPAFIVTGARASGKSHFLHVLALELGAPVLTAAEALDVMRAADRGGPAFMAIDDFDRESDPRRALEFLERARSAGRRLALGGAAPVGSWARGLSDLESRLAAMPAVHLPEPDEDLLAAVIRQHFATRQLKAAAGVAAYAAPRISRTFAAANAFAETAARLAADHGRPINLAVAKKAVEWLLGAADSP